MAETSYTCPHCGMTSHNPNDAREGYCGACHRWNRDPVLLADLLHAELARLDELARVRSMIGVLQTRERELVTAHEVFNPTRMFAE